MSRFSSITSEGTAATASSPTTEVPMVGDGTLRERGSSRNCPSWQASGSELRWRVVGQKVLGLPGIAGRKLNEGVESIDVVSNSASGSN